MTRESKGSSTPSELVHLHELAFGNGAPLELSAICTDFLAALSTRAGGSSAAVWLRSGLLHATDPTHVSASEVSADELWTRASGGPFSAPFEPSFAGLCPAEGALTLFPLGDFGLLSLHSSAERALDPAELERLASPVRGFATALDLCLTRERLAHEIAARARSESESVGMQAQLRHSQKLEAVGRLAGGIAHDFNNLLMSMLSTVELMQLDNEDPQTLEDLADITNAGQRATELTRQLLTFARPGESTAVAVDLDEIVLEVAKLLRRTFDRNVELRTRVSLGGRKIHGTASALHTVLMNLAINARDAMPEGGTLVIETDPSPAAIDNRAGEFVALRVSDTGQGMTKEVRERLFDPFFTTKERGRGTGLGLSTVYGIVQAHQGEVRVSSEPGEGTTFELLFPLPAADAELAEDETDAALSLPLVAPHATTGPLTRTPQRNGLILLVDDGEGPRPTSAAALERLGYEVTLAQNKRRTLELADAHSGLHAALVSLRKLGIDEIETLERLREGLPTLPIILLAGAAEDGATLTRLGMNTSLPMSFAGDQLEQAIARARVDALLRPRS